MIFSSRTLRALIAALALIAGFLLTFPAAWGFWLDREVFDRDSFIATSKDVMRTPEVEDAMAQHTAEYIVERYSLPASRTSVVKSLVEPSVPLYADSPQTDEALNQLYDTFVEVAHAPDPDTEDETLVLDLSFIAREALEPLRPLIGDVGIEFLMGEPDIVVVAEGEDVMDMYRLMGRAEEWSFPLAAAVVIAFVLAVVISPSRPAALLGAGVLIALAGAILYAISGDIAWNSGIDRAAIEPESLDAARAGYDVWAGSFRDQQVVLIIAGGVIAAGGLLLGVLGAALPSRERS